MWASGVKAAGSFDSRFKANRNVSTGQSIPNTTWTKVAFDEEQYDNLGEYDHSSNYRFTANEAGVYHFEAAVCLQFLGAGSALRVTFTRNGSAAGGNQLIPVQQAYRTGIGEDIASVSMDYDLDAGDYIEVEVWHNHGSARNLVEESIFSGYRFA